MIQTKHAVVVVVVLGLSFLTWSHEQNVKKEKGPECHSPKKQLNFSKTYAFCSHDGRVSLFTPFSQNGQVQQTVVVVVVVVCPN